MAPYTYVELALGAALGGCILFGSLPGQALHFGDLDFMADHLGQLWRNEENVALPHISTSDHGLA